MFTNYVKNVLSQEIPFQIPWSTTLQTGFGERVCVIGNNFDSGGAYPVLCLIDYGTEVGSDTFTEYGEYDVGVKSLNSLILISEIDIT